MAWCDIEKDLPAWGDNVICELENGELVTLVVASDAYMEKFNKIKRWCLCKDYESQGSGANGKSI